VTVTAALPFDDNGHKSRPYPRWITLGLGFSPESRYHQARVISLPDRAPKISKSGEMPFETRYPDDRIRALCARAQAAEDPDEIDNIMHQLRVELRDQLENVRRMVEVHRRHAAENSDDDQLHKSA